MSTEAAAKQRPNFAALKRANAGAYGPHQTRKAAAKLADDLSALDRTVLRHVNNVTASFSSTRGDARSAGGAEAATAKDGRPRDCSSTAGAASRCVAAGDPRKAHREPAHESERRGANFDALKPGALGEQPANFIGNELHNVPAAAAKRPGILDPKAPAQMLNAEQLNAMVALLEKAEAFTVVLGATADKCPKSHAVIEAARTALRQIAGMTCMRCGAVTPYLQNRCGPCDEHEVRREKLRGNWTEGRDERREKDDVEAGNG